MPKIPVKALEETNLEMGNVVSVQKLPNPCAHGLVTTIFPFFHESKGRFQRLCSARISLAIAFSAIWPRVKNAGGFPADWERSLVLVAFIGGGWSQRSAE
jgi:hypothetical protein